MTILLFFAAWWLVSVVIFLRLAPSERDLEVTTEEQTETAVGRLRAAIDAGLHPVDRVSECADHGRVVLYRGRCPHGCEVEYRTLTPRKVKRRNRKMKLVAGGAR